MFIKNSNRKVLGLIGLLFTYFVIAILCSTLGAAQISFIEALLTIIKKVPLIGGMVNYEPSSTYKLIILNIRLPRILVATLVGMGLSLVGVSFQAMFKNPMADPYVLGISSGAALGASLAMVFGVGGKVLGPGSVTIMAFLGSLITTFVVYNLSRVGNKLPTTTLLLSGVTVTFFFSSIISMLMVFNRQQVEKIVFWTMGSLNTSSWKQVLILFPIMIIAFAIYYYYHGDLNIMLTGDDSAQSLGINVEMVKKILLVLSSIVVAAAVSFCGIIGFVGLIIPHVVRILIGGNHKYLIPYSALVGGIFVVLSDTLARTAASPSELPVGAVTALFGAPFFAYLLMKNKKKGM